MQLLHWPLKVSCYYKVQQGALIVEPNVIDHEGTNQNTLLWYALAYLLKLMMDSGQ